MFEELKKKKKTTTINPKAVVAWVLFSIIIIVFIFLGMNPDSGGMGAGGAAAQVNNRVITMREFSEAYENLRRQYGNQDSGNPEMERQRAAQLQEAAIEQLVNFELIHQGAVQSGFLVTDAEVRDTLTNMKEFQEDGRFKGDRYRALLQSVGKSPADFEDQIRRQLIFQKTQRAFAEVLKPLPMEVKRQKELSETKANVEFAQLSTESLVEPKSISDAEASAFASQAGNEAKIKDYFEVHKMEYSTPEQVRARHILIKVDKAVADSDKKALDKIQDIAKKVKAGEDFGNLAKQFSEDPGSKKNGGDLSYFSRGKMVPEFENAAFSMAPNQVSEPIKTDFGYHLIQVLEKKAATTADFAQRKDEIAKTLLAQDKSKAAFEEVKESVKTGQAGEIEKIIQRYKLKWEETGPFSIETESIPKVGTNDEFVSTAFSLTPQAPIATNLVRQGPTAYILRYKAVPAEKPKDKKEKSPFENPEVMEEMMAERAASERSQDTLRRWLQSLKKTASVEKNYSILRR